MDQLIQQRFSPFYVAVFHQMRFRHPLLRLSQGSIGLKRFLLGWHLVSLKLSVLSCTLVFNQSLLAIRCPVSDQVCSAFV